MQLIKLTDDPIVRRLRRVMVAAMLFSMGNTLAGQPGSFWQHPETAVRGDGLPIHNATNHTFEFFLSHGWQAYVGACLIYILAALLLVSLLPRIAALIAAFSFLFGHFFGASNWLAVRWHSGVVGPGIYGLVLAAMVVLAAFPAADPGSLVVKRLRWVMVGALLLDFAVTLVGQPGSYWHHPETVHEANALSRWFLAQGWPVFVVYVLLYLSATFLVASRLPRIIALVWIFDFTLVGFGGASCWSFYEWRMGMATPVVYGVALSVIIVSSAFADSRKLA